MISPTTLTAKKEMMRWDYQNMVDWFRVELTYTSNAIEGSTFTQKETAVVLTQNITVAGKTTQEHLDIVNHAKAYDAVVECAQDFYKNKMSEDVIKNIHRHVLSGNTHAGSYRDVPVRIVGSHTVLPNHLKVPKLMQDFVAHMCASNAHVIDQALYAHYQLVTIHPFVDGNGRTARLLLMLFLLAEGFPPLIVPKEDRVEYLQVLEDAQVNGAYQAYVDFMYQALDKTLNMALAIEGA